MATKKPTGLAASRKGKKFTFTWKIADKNYDGGARIIITNQKRKLINDRPVSGKTTSYGYDFNLNEEFPGVSFYVRGKKADDTMSPWAHKSWPIYVPSVPTASYTRDSSYVDAGTFSWSTTVNETWWSIYTGYEWQSKLFSKWQNETPPTDWSGGYSGKRTDGKVSDSWYKQEDDWIFNDPDYSFTRWFRVRSVGPKGKSAWKTIYHTYALPRPAAIKAARLSPKSVGNGYMCTIEWSSPWDFKYPITDCVAEYSIVAPETTTSVDPVTDTRKVTWRCPGEASWTTAGTVKGASENHAITFPIERTIDDGEVVFVRVQNRWDGQSIPSGETRATGVVGALPLPVGAFETPDPETHRVRVTVTNSSELADSFIAVYYRTDDQPMSVPSKIIGIIPKDVTSATIQCPDWGTSNPVFGLKTLLADYSPSNTTPSEYTEYTIVRNSVKMQSKDVVWEDGKIPKAPKVGLTASGSDTIHVIWDWPWAEADQTELSWSTDPDAWESTNQPQTYTVSNVNSGQWNIAGLSVGTWYVRARLLKIDGDNTTYGMWSTTESIKLSSAPATPSLDLSPAIITPDGETRAYWAYASTDGTSQLQAEICEATLNDDGSFTYGDAFARTQTAQHITISAEEQGWEAGSRHYLAVRVTSASGEQSEGWSVPMTLDIAEPVTATITSTSLDDVVVDTSEEEPITELCLTELPLDVTVTGTGESGSTTLVIVRSGYYIMDRPDERTDDGFDGETIFMETFDGDGELHITRDGLIGRLDDSATYQLFAIAQDAYGQRGESEHIEFKVRWDHQAVVPGGTVEIDDNYNAAILSPTVPEGTTVEEGDVCDIYRLSIDRPELIYEGAEFGQRYVDPYPTIGRNGGYRFVYRTKNNDYTTADGLIAWYDTNSDPNNEFLNKFGVIINYGDNRVILPYNVTLSNKWSKDFQTTNYLGGHIQGDWNDVVSRSGTIGTVGVVSLDYGTPEDNAVIRAVRDLAIYSGVCHVRTPDGSSFAANVNVSEDRENKMINQLANYSLEITKVDSESLDGITYEEWLGQIGEE